MNCAPSTGLPQISRVAGRNFHRGVTGELRLLDGNEERDTLLTRSCFNRSIVYAIRKALRTTTVPSLKTAVYLLPLSMVRARGHQHPDGRQSPLRCS